MPKAYDLTNQRFGRLTAKYKCNYKKGNKYPWHCICDCGNEVDVRTQDLTTGKTQSCGCLQKEKASGVGKKTIEIVREKHLVDLIGKEFNYLTVIERSYKNNSYGYWKCRCKCGNEIIVRTCDLQSGNTSSCGCLKKSKGEEKICQILDKNNIPYQREYRIYNPNSMTYYRFDFYVNDKYMIEYDGIQHFKEINFYGSSSLAENQQKDAYKNQWCKDNNISLIRIPYTHYNNLTIKDLLLETSDFII